MKASIISIFRPQIILFSRLSRKPLSFSDSSFQSSPRLTAASHSSVACMMVEPEVLSEEST
jgi:hypothetical protein